MKHIKTIAAVTIFLTMEMSFHAAEHPNLLEILGEGPSDLGILEEMNDFLEEQYTGQEELIETPENIGSRECIADRTRIEQLSSNLGQEESSTEPIQNSIEIIQCEAVQFPDNVPKNYRYQCRKCTTYFTVHNGLCDILRHFRNNHNIEIKNITNEHFNVRLGASSRIFRIKYMCGHYALYKSFNAQYFKARCKDCKNVRPINTKSRQCTIGHIPIETDDIKQTSYTQTIETIQGKTIQFPDNIPQNYTYQCNKCKSPKYVSGEHGLANISHHLCREHGIKIEDITNEYFSVRSGTENLIFYKIEYSCGHSALSKHFNKRCRYCCENNRSGKTSKNPTSRKRTLDQISIETPVIEILSNDSDRDFDEEESSVEPELPDPLKALEEMHFIKECYKRLENLKKIGKVSESHEHTLDQISVETPVIELLSSCPDKEKSSTGPTQDAAETIRCEPVQFTDNVSKNRVYRSFRDIYSKQGYILNPIQDLEIIQCNTVQFPDDIPQNYIYRCNECKPRKHLSGGALMISTHLHHTHRIETKDVTNENFSIRLDTNSRLFKLKHLCGHYSLSKRYKDKSCDVCKYL